MDGLRILLVFGTVGWVAACGGSDAPDAAGPWTDSDVEYQLAALDGAALTESGIDMYATALDSAEAACTEDRRFIGDMAVTGRDIVRDGGGEVTLLELIRALPDSVPAEIRPTKCTDIMAAVVTLMNA